MAALQIRNLDQPPGRWWRICRWSWCRWRRWCEGYTSKRCDAVCDVDEVDVDDFGIFRWCRECRRFCVDKIKNGLWLQILGKNPSQEFPWKTLKTQVEKRLLVDIFDGYPYRTLFPWNALFMKILIDTLKQFCWWTLLRNIPRFFWQYSLGRHWFGQVEISKTAKLKLHDHEVMREQKLPGPLV